MMMRMTLTRAWTLDLACGAEHVLGLGLVHVLAVASAVAVALAFVPERADSTRRKTLALLHLPNKESRFWMGGVYRGWK